MCSCLALVLKLSSEVRNANAIKDIDNYITVVTNVISTISVVVNRNLFG